MNKEVRIRTCFLLIGDIDTKKQQFVAEVKIEATWKIEREGDQFYGENFDPKLVITNLEETRNESKWYTTGGYDQTGAPHSNWVRLHWRIKGVFYENMELQNFPRDVQDIGIRVSSDWKANEIELIPDEGVRMSTVDVDNFQDDQEWTLFKHVEVDHIPEMEKEDDDIQHGYTAGMVVARCRVARKMEYFMVNSVMIMFCLIILSLTIFAYDQGSTMRIGSSMTLLLVAVAFKLSVAGTLPLISYLTYLDIYILSGMLYLCSMIIFFAAISPFKNKDFATDIDQIALIVLAAGIVSFHTIYGLVFWINTNKRIKEMRKKDQEYVVKLHSHRANQKELREQKTRARLHVNNSMC